MDIGLIRRDELAPARLAEFGAYAAACNADPLQHVGYVGLEPEDVTAELRDIEGDYVVAEAREGTRLCGLLCAEWDLAIGRTWLYGPWAPTATLMDSLYHAVRPLLPAGVAQHELFVDARNAAVVAFAERSGFTKRGEHVILRFARESLRALAPVRLPPLTPELREQFAALHDRVFPGTHAPSPVLLAKSPPILVAVEDGTLLGYVTLKLRPEFADAQIEYVGVAEAARGKGVGAGLVTAALHEAFTDPRFDVMDLVTNNPVARRLYEKVGFTLLREMRSFRTPG